MIKGYKLYLSRSNTEQLNSFSGFDKIETTDFYVLFINSDNFEHYKEYLIKGEHVIEKTAFFNFKCYFSSVKNDVESKFCNHQNATLEIYEIQEM